MDHAHKVAVIKTLVAEQKDNFAALSEANVEEGYAAQIRSALAAGLSDKVGKLFFGDSKPLVLPQAFLSDIESSLKKVSKRDKK